MGKKVKAVSVIGGMFAAAGLGFLWGKKRNDRFEIEDFPIEPETGASGSSEPEDSPCSACAAEKEEPEEKERENPTEGKEQKKTPEEVMQKININTATAEELSGIRGIGMSKAVNIVKHREENGFFAAVDDLLKVYGIAEKKLTEIRDRITV